MIPFLPAMLVDPGSETFDGYGLFGLVVGTAVVDGTGRALGKGPGRQTPFFLSAHLGEALNRQQGRMARNFTIASVTALAAGVLVMIFRLS